MVSKSAKFKWFSILARENPRKYFQSRWYLFWKDCYVLVEWLWGADVTAGDARVPGGASRQLTLLEDQREQGEERVSEKQDYLWAGESERWDRVSENRR